MVLIEFARVVLSKDAHTGLFGKDSGTSHLASIGSSGPVGACSKSDASAKGKPKRASKTTKADPYAGLGKATAAAAPNAKASTAALMPMDRPRNTL